LKENPGMKNKTIWILILILIAVVPSQAFSQSSGTLNAIQTAVPFLTIAPDSRAGAMGDAGAATSPDCFSLHWNAAKYAFIDRKSGVAMSYSPWLRTLVPDMNIAYLTGYYRFDSKQTVAASLTYNSFGEVVFTDEFGNTTNTFKANEFAIDGSYSRLFSEYFSGAVAMRFIYSNLTGGMIANGTETKPGTSFAADLSGYYRKDIEVAGKAGLFALGLNFSNIGAKLSYTDSRDPDFIPMNMKLGTSGTINLDAYNSITLVLDLNKLLVPTPPIYYNIGDTTRSGVVVTVPKSVIKYGKPDLVSVPVGLFQSFYDAPGGYKEELHEITYSFGAEYWYNKQFAIRCGYFHENQTKGNRKYFTAGAGVRMNIFSLDFSYLMPLAQNNPLARTIRFTLSFDFNSLGNVAKTKG
jgi:hypothetical protein